MHQNLGYSAWNVKFLRVVSFPKSERHELHKPVVEFPEAPELAACDGDLKDQGWKAAEEGTKLEETLLHIGKSEDEIEQVYSQVRNTRDSGKQNESWFTEQ